MGAWLTLRGYVRRRLRRGRTFRRILCEMEERQTWSPAQISVYQEQRLSELLLVAATSVPFYREFFQREHIDVRATPPREVLARIPVLRKSVVRQNPEQFLNGSVPRWRLTKAYTSGTTGTPLICYRDLYSITFEHAMIWRQWRWAGFGFHDRRATLRGDLVIPTSQTHPPFWKLNHGEDQMIMSSYHLGEPTIRHYVEALDHFKPKAIEGYPSSVYLLACALRQAPRAPYPMAGVFTSSETLAAQQREVIEDVFQCRVFDLYGNTERTVAVGSCAHGSYHIFSDYGLVELEPVAGTTDLEIVGTSLCNRAFVLLRYGTDDLAVPGTEPCACRCGFPTLTSIQGRLDCYIHTPDGYSVGRLDHIYKGVSNVLESQIVQEALDHVVLKVVPADGYNSSDEQLLLKRARERLGPRMKIEVQIVDSIPRTSTGKFVAVVSKLQRREVRA
jgi:phenylacetate-CoA ligase